MRHKLPGIVAIASLIACACTGQEKEPPRQGVNGPSGRRIAASTAADVRSTAAEARPDSSVLSVAQPAFRAVQGPRTQDAPDRDAAPIPGERKLVRRGDMTLEVRSVTEALAALGRIIGSVGGHTANQSERHNEYGGRSASVICRVPAGQLDATVAAVTALGLRRTLTLNAEDITTAYFDAGVRIKTQSELARQLVVLLARPTNKLSDLLEIERELARVREEIDRLNGRTRLWDNQVALSSLAITLEEPAPIVAGTGGGLRRTLGQSFGAAAENFVLVLAGIIAATGSVLPAVVLVGAGWLAIRRWWRRRAPASPVV